MNLDDDDDNKIFMMPTLLYLLPLLFGKKKRENLKIIHMNSIVFDKLGIFLDGKIKKEMGEKS